MSCRPAGFRATARPFPWCRISSISPSISTPKNRCCATGTSDASSRLRDTAFHDPRSYFHRYALLSDEEATATALAIWERTNLANLEDNILPTRPRATLILKKGADHVVETVALRRL